MKQQELRTRLEGDLPPGGDSDELWTLLLDDCWVEAVEDGDNSYQDLLARARRLLSLPRGPKAAQEDGHDSATWDDRQAAPLHPRAPASTSDNIPEEVGAPIPPSKATWLTPNERARAGARAVSLAQHAAQLQVVCAMRSTFGDERLLSAAEAFNLLRSSAVQWLTPDEFARNGIAPVGHNAQIIHQAEEWDDKGEVLVGSATIGVHPPGIEITVERREEATRDRLRGHLILPSSILLVPSEDGKGRMLVPYWPGSLLDVVRGVANSLTERYGWDEFPAVWWLLTGAVPIASPLRVSIERDCWNAYTFDGDFEGVRDHNNALIKIEVEAWVSAQTVTRAFLASQRSVLPTVRPIKAKATTLLRFVAERTNTAGKRPRWRQLLDEWNHVYPDWAYTCYAYPYRQMAADWRRTLRTVIYPLPPSDELGDATLVDQDGTEGQLV